MKSDSKNIDTKEQNVENTIVKSCGLDIDGRYQGISEMFKSLIENLISPADILNKPELLDDDATSKFSRLSNKYNETLCSIYFTTICAIDAPFLKNLSPGELQKLITNQDKYFESLVALAEPICKKC